eukprot:scaffold150889_cov39-Tisochrysis_lutea.AAC.3
MAWNFSLVHIALLSSVTRASQARRVPPPCHPAASETLAYSKTAVPSQHGVEIAESAEGAAGAAGAAQIAVALWRHSGQVDAPHMPVRHALANGPHVLAVAFAMLGAATALAVAYEHAASVGPAALFAAVSMRRPARSLAPYRTRAYADLEPTATSSSIRS